MLCFKYKGFNGYRKKTVLNIPVRCTLRINNILCFYKDYRHAVAFVSGAEHR